MRGREEVDILKEQLEGYSQATNYRNGGRESSLEKVTKIAFTLIGKSVWFPLTLMSLMKCKRSHLQKRSLAFTPSSSGFSNTASQISVLP